MQQQVKKLPNFMTSKETARFLDVSEGTLSNWRLGKVKAPLILPFYQFGGRVLYDRSEVVEAVQKMHKEAEAHARKSLDKAL